MQITFRRQGLHGSLCRHPSTIQTIKTRKDELSSLNHPIPTRIRLTPLGRKVNWLFSRIFRCGGAEVVGKFKLPGCEVEIMLDVKGGEKSISGKKLRDGRVFTACYFTPESTLYVSLQIHVPGSTTSVRVSSLFFTQSSDSIVNKVTVRNGGKSFKCKQIQRFIMFFFFHTHILTVLTHACIFEQTISFVSPTRTFAFF